MKPNTKQTSLTLLIGFFLSVLTAASSLAYIDNGDGTFADLSTGKMWLKDTECLGPSNWNDAFTIIADFNTANSTSYNCQSYTATYTDWVLPSANDLAGISFGPGDSAFFLKGSSSADYELWSSDIVPPTGPPLPTNPAIIQAIRDTGGGNFSPDNQAIVDQALLYHFVAVRTYTDLCPQDPAKIRPGLCGCGVADSDTDSDGVVDCLDLCPGFDDAIDADKDLMPDACDTFPNDGREWADSDGDTIGDNADICPYGDDALQSDADGVADDCDAFPTDDQEWRDSDNDGIGDNEDNCPLEANPAQTDTDGDTLGNICDPTPSLALFGSVVDAPHNAARGIFCVDCHSYSLWWQFSPVDGQASSNTRKDATCLGCHGSGADNTQSHSASNMGPMHRSALGDWSVACSQCHNPHRQEQLVWRSSNATSLYLITGSFGDNTTFAIQNGTTAFTYTLGNTNDPSWSTPSSWADKDHTAFPSGLILVEDTANATNTHEILSANATTIIIKGGIDKNQAANGSFGLIYGRLIRADIDAPSGPKPVKYFSPDIDSYVDLTLPPKGLCQVCHESTLYWTSDGLNTGHYTGTNCTTCHKPALGFKSYEVDTTPPVISLIGSTSITTECGSPFSDPGATVTDNSSINLTVNATSLDVMTTGPQTITYSGTDNSGNTATPVIRDVRVEDTTNPTLTLIGSASVLVAVGGPYIEEGAQPFDSCKITNSVSIGGNVDVNTPGTYQRTYDISDDEGNAANQITRSVVVGRWIDNSDGTITDKATGLIWLQDGNCTDLGGPLNWDNATAVVSSLNGGGTMCGLNDGSLAGSWRLPTRTELYDFANGVEAIRALTPFYFTGVQSDYYWTSTEVSFYTPWAYYNSLLDGQDGYDSKTLVFSVIAVRNEP